MPNDYSLLGYVYGVCTSPNLAVSIPFPPHFQKIKFSYKQKNKYFTALCTCSPMLEPEVQTYLLGLNKKNHKIEFKKDLNVYKKHKLVNSSMYRYHKKNLFPLSRISKVQIFCIEKRGNIVFFFVSKDNRLTVLFSTFSSQQLKLPSRDF